jgi:hypothetical protein
MKDEIPNPKVLGVAQIKLGDRRVEVASLEDGGFGFQFHKKTGYRTKEVTRLRLTREATYATIKCISKL